MVHSGILFVLFCTVNWLDVEGLNIEVGAQIPSLNHWLKIVHFGTLKIQ